MGKATGDRASRRKRNLIIEKGLRKARRIRDIAARQGYSTAPPTDEERREAMLNDPRWAQALDGPDPNDFVLASGRSNRL